MLNSLNIDYYLKDFKISKKYDLYKKAIFANNKETFYKIEKLIDDNLNSNNDIDYYRGFLAGIYDAEGSLDSRTNGIRIFNSDEKILLEIRNGLKLLDLPFTERKNKQYVNKQCSVIRILGNGIIKNKQKNNAYEFIRIVNPKIKRKIFQHIGGCYFIKNNIKKIDRKYVEQDVYNLQTSTRTYVANNILVHNCYQCNKSSKRMTFDVAKKFIDMLFDTDDGSVLANIIEFIGGEPFLEIDLITQICEYWDYKCIMENRT